MAFFPENSKLFELELICDFDKRFVLKSSEIQHHMPIHRERSLLSALTSLEFQSKRNFSLLLIFPGNYDFSEKKKFLIEKRKNEMVLEY